MVTGQAGSVAVAGEAFILLPFSHAQFVVGAGEAAAGGEDAEVGVGAEGVFPAQLGVEPDGATAARRVQSSRRKLVWLWR